MFQHLGSFLFTLLCFKFLIEDSIQKKILVCPSTKAQFPDSDDRRSFYKCDAGRKPISFRCPEKTWFNPSLGVCELDNESQQSSNVSANSSGGYWLPTSEGGSNGTNGGGNGNPSESNNPPPNIPLVTGNLQQPKPDNPTQGKDNKVFAFKMNKEFAFTNDTCPLHGPLFYQNPEDCSSYFFCYRGRLVPYFCPPLTYYTPLTTDCVKRIYKKGCIFVSHHSIEI